VTTSTTLYVYALTNEGKEGPNAVRVSFTSDPNKVLEAANEWDPRSGFSFAALSEAPNARSVIMTVRNRLRRYRKCGQWFAVSGAIAGQLLRETISQSKGA
jgi:hypothetical protein